MLATGDKLGKVRLFKYPSVKADSDFKEYNGHSSEITRIRFSYNESCLISVGRFDRAVILWKTDFSEVENTEREIGSTNN